jgi:predicted metalloprotease
MWSSLRRLSRIVGVGLVGTVSIAACGTTVAGNAVSVFANPFSVAGMPATDGPSGLRDDPAAPTRTVLGTDGGTVDELGVQSVSDIEEFWKSAYGDAFGGEFTPVREVHSWDSGAYGGEFCGSETNGLVNAGYCFDDRTIGWDRGELLPSLQRANGDMAVTMVLAHEYGHAVQHQAKLITPDAPTLVGEQQADCLAGVYMRWVAEGKSPRFTLSTGDGLNNLLAAMIAFRDPLLNVSDPEAGTDEHGSAFERVSAFQFGFTDGPKSCAAIDEKEIEQRRGDLPVLLADDETGELPVTEDSVRSVVDALGILFHPTDPPRLTFGTDQCADARMRPPVAYCPATNTIVVDLPALAAAGTPSDSDDGGGLASGDNTAYSILVSRYMQAIQKQHGGVALDNAEAGLRTACLTGVATTKMTQTVTTPDGNTIALTAGDVDEAVSGILVNGLVASDVNGDTVPSGFSRIDAFRVGVLGDVDRCFARFS